MQWKLKGVKAALKTMPFTVEEIELRDKDNQPPDHPYYRLSCQDWVNTVPITEDGQIILIRQLRVGTMSMVLEIPGGVIDRGENDPLAAAKRELEEETGFTSENFISLGAINPNPAIMTNRIHIYLAQNCVLPKVRQHFPDKHEEIEVVKLGFAEAVEMVVAGKIDHSLGALGILLAEKHLNKQTE